MSNDLRIGLACGVACVFAVAVLFFQKAPAENSAPAPKPSAAQPEPNVPPASIPGGPLPRPKGLKSLSNPVP